MQQMVKKTIEMRETKAIQVLWKFIRIQKN
jgi:hypothetical protein